MVEYQKIKQQQQHIMGNKKSSPSNYGKQNRTHIQSNRMPAVTATEHTTPSSNPNYNFPDQATVRAAKLTTIEAELVSYLNISWADARDLASYAKGKHGVLPGDKNGERIKRYAIIQSAIEADAQFPKKRLVPKQNKTPKLSAKEQRIQQWARDYVAAVDRRNTRWY